MPREELKVTIITKGGKAFIAAQATDCDPKLKAMEGDLAAVLAAIPAFIEQSNKEWDVSPRNPKAPEPPKPAPRPAAVQVGASKPGVATPAGRTVTPSKPAQPVQHDFF